MASHATFRIRNKTELYLIVKKKKGEITREDVANTVSEAWNDISIWPTDIEELERIQDAVKLRELFKEIDNKNKFFM